MDDISQIGGQKDHCQRADDLGTVCRDHRAQQAEDAERRETEDHFHDFHENVVPAVYSFGGFFNLFSEGDDRKSDQKRHDNDLKHVGLSDGFYEVLGEDPYEHVHHGLPFGRFIGQAVCGEDRIHAFEKIGKGKADHGRNSCRAKIVDDGDSADGSDLADILERYYAGHYGKEHDRTYDELDQIQKDRSERFDVGIGELHIILQ